MLVSTSVHAETVDEMSPLAGNWTNSSHDGIFTQLEIEESGKFVFRELHTSDLRRSYMCGSVTDQGDALSLAIGQQKERDQAGGIAQAVGQSQGQFIIQSRSDNRLVLTIDSRTVILERAG